MPGRRRRPTPSGRPRIAIVGANFAGLRVAQRLGRDCDVTVFDPSPWFEWLPNIHELVSGTKLPTDLRLPRKRLVKRAGHRFVRAAVAKIDATRGWLATVAGGRHDFDYCVVAVGGVNETFGVAGVERHALPFKSVGDCEEIRRRLARLARSRTRKSVVIVGGGFVGVEALGEILRRYRGRSNLAVHIVEAGARLMSGTSRKIDVAVRRHCARFGAQVHTGSPAASVTRTGVRLHDGRRLHSDLTLWTGGVSAPSLLRTARLAPKSGSWAAVEPTLRSRRFRNVFIAGDAAGLVRPLAKQAFYALEMGECVADNLQRAIRGQPLRKFRPSGTPMLVAFGDLDTFLVAGRSVVASTTLAAAKEAVYQVTMAQIDPPSNAAALGKLASRVVGTARRVTAIK